MNEEDTAELIADLANHTRAFTDWEIKFLDSVATQFYNGRTLSEKQYAVLYKMEAKVR